MPTAKPNSTGSTPAQLDAKTPLYPVPAGAKTPGITVYDWLAAIAMQGLVTHGVAVKADRAMTQEDKDLDVAQRAYNLANAMLRVRAESFERPE